MTLSMFSVPYAVFRFLPFIGAASLAIIAWASSGPVGSFFERTFGKKSLSRLSEFAGGDEKEKSKAVQVGSFEHRVRLAFKKFNIKVEGQENSYLWIARIGLGVGLMVGMLVLGLPLLTSFVGLLAGYVFVNGQVTRAWNAMRTQMEAEIPALLAGLKSASSSDGNVPQSLADAARSLSKGPLREWAEATASKMHAEGVPGMKAIRDEAAGISTSLAIVVELITRMWTTGGKGYAEAFESAATNLRSVLQARVMARARGAGAMQTVHALMGGFFVMIVYLIHSPSMAGAVSSPLIQVAYIIIFALMVYGYNYVGNMIDTAV